MTERTPRRAAIVRSLPTSLLISLLSMSSIVAAAPIPTDPPEAVDAFFDGAREVVVVDWNRDGRDDVVGGAFDGLSLSLWRNETFGWLETSFSIPPNRVSALAVGDFDDDGTDDIVYAQNAPEGGTDRVAVVLNRSSAHHVTVDDAVIDGPECLVTADFDRDGDVDVATCEFGVGRISWHENSDGEGETWTTTTAATISAASADALVRDVDGDGDPDLVVVTFVDLVWLENRLDQAGADWVVHTIDDDVPAAYNVAMGDLDGDGTDEIVAGAVNTPTLAFWEPPAIVTSPWTRHDIATLGTSDLALDDVDADGDLDVVTVQWAASGKLEVWENDGAAGFTSQEMSGTWDVPRSVALGDLDLDGDLDFVVAGGNSDRVDVVENRTVRSSVAFQSVTENRAAATRGSASAPVAVAAADLDLDGDVDIVGFDDDGSLRLRETWETATGTLLANTGNGLLDPRAFALGDIDGDGDLDIVTGTDAGLHWHEHLSVGSPFIAKEVDPSTAIVDLRVVDLNHDGHLDVVAFDAALMRLRWWRNVGFGTGWVGNFLDSAFGTYSAMALGDLERDGQVEVLVSADGSLTAYTRLADIAFSTQVLDAAFELPLLVAGDFDADGDVDVAGADPVSGELLFWANDGSGGGWTLTGAEFLPDPRDLAVADVDHDGDLDIVGVGPEVSAVALIPRTSPSPFPTESFQVADLQASQILLDDFDGDGDVDAVGLSSAGVLFQAAGLLGQYTVALDPRPPSALPVGETVEILEFDVEHLGRSGDQDIVLSEVTLGFRDAQGLLEVGELDDLLESVRVVAVSGGLEIAEEVAPFAGSPLVLSIDPPRGSSSIPAPPDASTGSSALFRVEIEIAPTTTLTEFRLRYSGSGSEFRTEDEVGNALTELPWAVQSRVYTVDTGVIFQDGFESGSTSAWGSL